MRLKSLLLILALLPISLRAVPPPPYTFTIDTAQKTAPQLDVYQANTRTFQVFFKDNGTAENISNCTPYMVWFTNRTASTMTTSSYSIVGQAATGTVQFVFSAAQLNTNGMFQYEVGLRDSSSNLVTYRQGAFNMVRSPYSAGAGSISYTTAFDWSLYSFVNLPTTLAGYTITDAVGMVSFTSLSNHLDNLQTSYNGTSNLLNSASNALNNAIIEGNTASSNYTDQVGNIAKTNLQGNLTSGLLAGSNYTDSVGNIAKTNLQGNLTSGLLAGSNYTDSVGNIAKTNLQGNLTSGLLAGSNYTDSVGNIAKTNLQGNLTSGLLAGSNYTDSVGNIAKTNAHDTMLDLAGTRQMSGDLSETPTTWRIRHSNQQDVVTFVHTPEVVIGDTKITNTAATLNFKSANFANGVVTNVAKIYANGAGYIAPGTATFYGSTGSRYLEANDRVNIYAQSGEQILTAPGDITIATNLIVSSPGTISGNGSGLTGLQYAASAGTAATATNATYAGIAGVATSATYAAVSGVSTTSTYAGTANVSTTATYAAVANVSTTATYAAVANVSTTATYAAISGVSTTATYAATANNASNLTQYTEAFSNAVKAIQTTNLAIYATNTSVTITQTGTGVVIAANGGSGTPGAGTITTQMMAAAAHDLYAHPTCVLELTNRTYFAASTTTRIGFTLVYSDPWGWANTISNAIKTPLVGAYRVDLLGWIGGFSSTPGEGRISLVFGNPLSSNSTNYLWDSSLTQASSAYAPVSGTYIWTNVNTSAECWLIWENLSATGAHNLYQAAAWYPRWSVTYLGGN